MPEREVREAPRVEHRRGDHRRLARLAAGSVESSAAAGSSDSGCVRRGALRRAGRAAREDHDAALAPRGGARSDGVAAARSRSSSVRVARALGVAASCQAMKRLRPVAGVADAAPRTPRRRSSATGSSRSTTSVICGPANAVLRYSAWAPSFEHATVGVDEAAVVAAHDRDAVALARCPRRRSAWASALVRSWTSPKVSVPELVDDRRLVRVADRRGGVAGGGRRAPAAAAPAPMRTSWSGRVGPDDPGLGEGRGGLQPCSSTWSRCSERHARGYLISRQLAAPTGASPRLDQRVDVRRAARVEEDVALADARLLGEQARRRAAPRRPPGRARARCRRSRGRGGRTPCGSRPTCPCRRGAGGSGGRRAGPGRGRRAGARRRRRRRRAARARPPRAPRPSAGRPAGRRAAPPPRRRAAGARRRSARAAARRRARAPGARGRRRAGGRCRPTCSSKASAASSASPASSRGRVARATQVARRSSPAAAPGRRRRRAGPGSASSTSAPTAAATSSHSRSRRRSGSARSAGVGRRRGEQQPVAGPRPRPRPARRSPSASWRAPRGRGAAPRRAPRAAARPPWRGRAAPAASSAAASVERAAVEAMGLRYPWMTESPVRRRIRATGRVQGVFFRDSTRREAERRGVAGWGATAATARSRRSSRARRMPSTRWWSSCRAGPGPRAGRGGSTSPPRSRRACAASTSADAVVRRPGRLMEAATATPPAARPRARRPADRRERRRRRPGRRRVGAPRDRGGRGPRAASSPTRSRSARASSSASRPASTPSSCARSSRRPRARSRRVHGERRAGRGRAAHAARRGLRARARATSRRRCERHFGDESLGRGAAPGRAVIGELLGAVARGPAQAVLLGRRVTTRSPRSRRAVAAMRQPPTQQHAHLRAMNEQIGCAAARDRQAAGREREALEVAAEHDRSTAKGRPYEEAVFDALDAIAGGAGDDCDAVGDLPGVGGRKGDVWSRSTAARARRAGGSSSRPRTRAAQEGGAGRARRGDGPARRRLRRLGRARPRSSCPRARTRCARSTATSCSSSTTPRRAAARARGRLLAGPRPRADGARRRPTGWTPPRVARRGRARARRDGGGAAGSSQQLTHATNGIEAAREILEGMARRREGAPRAVDQMLAEASAVDDND